MSDKINSRGLEPTRGTKYYEKLLRTSKQYFKSLLSKITKFY